MRKTVLVGQQFVNFPVHMALLSSDVPVDANNNSLASPDIKTASTTFTFSGESYKTSAITVATDFSHIVLAKLYVDATLGAVFAADATVSFYPDSAFKGRDAIFRAIGKLARTYLTSSMSIGASSAPVGDESNFSANDLVRLNGGTSELGRVVSTSTGVLNLEDPAEFTHSSGAAACKVLEIGGFSLYDGESSNHLFAKISFSAVQTVNVQLDIVYTIS